MGLVYPHMAVSMPLWLAACTAARTRSATPSGPMRHVDVDADTPSTSVNDEAVRGGDDRRRGGTRKQLACPCNIRDWWP